MATLQNIRKRSGLLLGVIGIAMLAFILGDFMQSRRSGGRGNVYVGEVYGEYIHIQDFENRLQEGLENWKIQNTNGVLNQGTITQVRNQVWNEYIKELIMNQEFEDLGIDVSDEEFFELLQGVNVHSEISKVPAFQDPSTKKFDRTKVLQYLKQIDQDQTGEARERWMAFQKYLVSLIKNNKYNVLVEKSCFVTTEEAKINFNDNSQNVTFNYVSIPYSSLNDTTEEYHNISQKEIKKYYKNNINDFQQKNSKDIDFVIFSVTPSSEDDFNTKVALDDLKKEFQDYEDYTLFAKRNSDNTSSKFVFNTKEDLEDPFWNELLENTDNTIIGPYESSPGVYRIAKIGEIEYRSDSVEARHILISSNSTINTDSAQRIINQYKRSIESGIDFGVLAEKYSEDKGSAIKGGDLGWFREGAMVDEFNQVCFTANIGELNIVNTQYGSHLVQITNSSKKKKKFKIIFIDRNVQPSSTTLNNYWSKASQFSGKILTDNSINFDTLVAQSNLTKRSDKKVESNKANISGIPNSREIVRWANQASFRNVSEVFELEDSYVVAYITKENRGGGIPLEEVSEEIKSKIIQDKKFIFISNKFNRLINKNNLTLNDIAEEFNSNVVTNKKTVLQRSSIDGIGYEPELAGKLFSSLEKESLSTPIKGKNSVFLFKIIEKDSYRSVGDFTEQRNQLIRSAKSYSASTVFSALEENGNVIDNRNDFY